MNSFRETDFQCSDISRKSSRGWGKMAVKTALAVLRGACVCLLGAPCTSSSKSGSHTLDLTLGRSISSNTEYI